MLTTSLNAAQNDDDDVQQLNNLKTYRNLKVTHSKLQLLFYLFLCISLSHIHTVYLFRNISVQFNQKPKGPNIFN